MVSDRWVDLVFFDFNTCILNDMERCFIELHAHGNPLFFVSEKNQNE